MTENVEQIRVEFVGDASKLEKASKDADAALDKSNSAVEQSKSKWRSVVDAMTRFSPKFKSISEDFNGVTEQMQDALGGITKSSKLMKVAVIGAVVAVAAKAVQAMWKVMDNAANYFDSRQWDKAQEAFDVSKNRFTTAVGAFTSPIVNGAKKIFGGILDGLTWALKKIYAGFNLVYGFLKGLFMPIINGIKTIIDTIASVLQDAVNALSSFLGFGQIFKKSAEGAEGIADSMESAGESAQLATGALQGFDKLNTMDVTGDVETSNEMKETAEEMQKIGEEWGTKIFEKLSGITKWFQNLDLGKVWESFVEFGGQAWETIKDVGERVWNGLCNIGTTAWNTIKSVATTVWTVIQNVGTIVWNVLSTIGSTVWNVIQTVATTVWTAIQTIGSTVWGVLKSVGESIWKPIQDVASGVWSMIETFGRNVWNTIKTVAETVWNTIQSVAETVWSIIGPPIEAIWGIFQKAGETAWRIAQQLGETFNRVVIDPIKSAVEWIVEKINWALEKVKKLKDSIGSIGKKLGGIGGAISSGITSVVSKITGHANGGVIEPNNPHLVMVGDNTREREVISPLSTMKQAMKEAMAESGGGNRGDIVLTINGKEFARATYDDIRAEGQRRGTIA